MSALDLNATDYKEKAVLVCLYYARLRSDDPKYKQHWSADLRLLSEKYGVKYKTLTNYKDALDSMFDNGRQGWHSKPLEKQSKFLYDVFTKYSDCTDEELSVAVSGIIREAKIESGPFFSIRTKDKATVSAILEKKKSVVFDGLNVLKDSLKKGRKVFLVLGGDRPSWDTGLIGVGVIIREPYDIGYSGSNFKVDVDVEILLDKPIKREDLVPYGDTYGTIGIAPITKWEPNQAVSQVPEKNAIALMRAMLDLCPAIEADLESAVDERTMLRIKGPTKIMVGVDVTFGENVGDSIYEMLQLEEAEKDTADSTADPYNREDFLNEVFMTAEQFGHLSQLLRRKKNVILLGAPGVGKTFIAERLAYSLMGVKDSSRTEMIQFHQSYSYEDFIMGYRPRENGFELREGIFYTFCNTAKKDPEHDYFFLIDEINRGNLSKIFGELFMLLESDKRGKKLRMIYSNQTFSVPDNVYIIGMMNTADRSLAMLDYALRRRFAFFEIEPGFGTEGFKKYQDSKGNAKFDRLLGCVENLNGTIADDDSLGEGFRIGHSYFMTEDPVTDEWLTSVVVYELIPLLKEYWFDEPDKVKDWSERLRGAIK